jgi:hypothetical protein
LLAGSLLEITALLSNRKKQVMSVVADKIMKRMRGKGRGRSWQYAFYHIWCRYSIKRIQKKYAENRILTIYVLKSISMSVGG